MNVLTERFRTKYETAPFDEIREEDFLPAFKELIERAEAEITGIAENNEEASFENTVEALAYAGRQLERVTSIFFNLNSAETNEKLQEIAQEVSPILTEFSSKMHQNQRLFERIKKVYNESEGLNLNTEEKMLLRETYRGFVRNGALLSEEEKKRLEEINIQLSVKQLQFGQNVLGATNDYYKPIINNDELRGIPEVIKAQYEEDAKEKGLSGYVITLQYPSFIPAMTYADNRELRKELFLANGSKCFDGGAFDNQDLIRELVRLRQEKAEILGYRSFADYVLEERMAETPEKVFEFLNQLLVAATPYAEAEISELKELAKADGIDDLQAYDHAYYTEKLRKAKYDLNDEELKPYFPLEEVEKAVFSLAQRLFGLNFREVEGIQKYHQEVKTYLVEENGKEKAILYVDYHPRKGKRAGAWMTSFKNQWKEGDENSRPHISVVCNFSKPTNEVPSLLSFQEVTTLFHEFGHALHGILADTRYPNLSGTSVKWDFVELPSQFLENYCYEPDFLRSFAKHYKTQEILSDEKIKKLNESKNFMEGYQTLRQLGFGLLDMAYHTKAGEVKYIKTFEKEHTARTNLYPSEPLTAISTSFSHIFQGGYSAGYYSYKWAEVLDADAFQYFKEKGIFDPETAEKYKKLLSSGGTVPPMELYKAFRGSEPKVESLLMRAFGSGGGSTSDLL